MISGFRITPVVALVQPGSELLLDAQEVQEQLGEVPLDTCSIPPITTGTATAPRSAARSWSFARSHTVIATSGAPPPGCSSPSIGCVSDPPMSDAERALGALLALMARLRDPQRGCPWDREQTFSSIAPYTIEEAYEVADAIDRGERDALRDELGDLLFQGGVSRPHGRGARLVRLRRSHQRDSR